MGLLKKEIVTLIIIFCFSFVICITSNAQGTSYVFTKHIEFDVSGTHSLVWGDYDNDNDQDLAIGNYDGQNFIYVNLPNHSFKKIPQFGFGKTNCLAFMDYDNDGDLDLAVANTGTENAIFINIDNGKEFLEENPFGNGARFLSWGDYDNDNDQDIAVCGAYSQNFLYEYEPNYFTPKDEFIYSTIKCFAWGDYDNDGDLDLATGNEKQNYLYKNNGNKTFTAVQEFGDDFTNYIAWGDYDNDDDLDLAVGNEKQNYLYRNDNNVFNRIPNFGNRKTYCLAWEDYDNDGDLDIAIGNDGENYLYTNKGNGDFIKKVEFGIKKTRSLAWGDYNKDGYFDIAIGNSDGYSFLYSYEKDSDDDGFGDSVDDFPDDPSASKDLDEDGYPENWNAGKSHSDSTTKLYIDQFPDNPKEWKDSDGDGKGDNEDPIDFMKNRDFFMILSVLLFIPIPLIIFTVKYYEKKKLKKDGYVISSHRSQKLNKPRNKQRRKHIQKRQLPSKYYEFPIIEKGNQKNYDNFEYTNENEIELDEIIINNNLKPEEDVEDFIKINKLTGKPLMNIDGELLGIIKDLVINIRTLKINKFIVIPDEKVNLEKYQKGEDGTIRIPFEKIISARKVVVIIQNYEIEIE